VSFEILGEITQVETIATGTGIREIAAAAAIWPGTLAKAEGCRGSPPRERRNRAC
jgi:hypothetical protein